MDIERVFQYHAPQGTQAARYVTIRSKAKELAAIVEECSPDSREKSLALTNIQQAVMWANAAIAINEVPGRPTWPDGDPQ
jgi:hypothetical protein